MLNQATHLRVDKILVVFEHRNNTRKLIPQFDKRIKYHNDIKMTMIYGTIDRYQENNVQLFS